MLLGGGAAHADLTIGSSVQWNDNNTRYISVYPGDSYVDAFIGGTGTPQQESADFMSFGTVTDYTFYNGTNKGVGGYATLNQGSDRLGAVDTTATASSALIATGVWTTADPGADAANFTSNTHINAVVSVSGTIDVTGLSSGTIYFLYGTNGTRNTDFQVTQTGGNTVQIAGNSFWVNTDTISAATAVGFTNDGSQNTITYSYAQTNAGKFMGVIISTFAGDAAPSWSSGYPKADTATTSGFTVRASINEAGTAYYVVLADGSTAPTTAEVVAGTGSGGAGAVASGSIALTADLEGTTTLNSLDPNTTYDIHFVAQDLLGNLQDAVISVTDKTTLEAVIITKVHVILLGGQSNADGRADPAGLPVDLQTAQTDVDLYEGGSIVDLQPLGGQFGPEITLGRHLADNLTNGTTERVAIIKYGSSGTSLAVDWVPGGDATTTGDGSHYVSFQNRVTSGMAALAAAYPGAVVEIEGMLWVQGERDAKAGLSYEDLYEANLTNFIADVRATYGSDLPFVISRLSDGQTNISPEPLATVRAAQTAVASADPFAPLIDTDGFGLNGDNLHFSAAGQQDLGNAAAATLLPFILGYDHWSGGLPPEGDANLDGVPDGIAWLLGADNPAANAIGLMPTAGTSNGDLTLSFNCLSAAWRGGAQAFVEYSRDLGLTDPWTSHRVRIPDESGNIDGVDFLITPNGDLNGVQIIIPASAAAPGTRLFSRISMNPAP